MNRFYSRRDMLKRTGQALAVAAVANPSWLRAENNPALHGAFGAIVDEKYGAEVGRKILAEGGNAIDAVAAAGLISCIAGPSRCGIGGYGGHMTIAVAGGKKVVSIDFNTAAPEAARPDMYPVDAHGTTLNRQNTIGWLAAGVPGTLAGIQHAIDHYGTRSFRESVQPAIRLAREGVPIGKMLAQTIKGCAANFRKDAGSIKLFLENGQPLKEGQLFRNPDLAEMLSTLADRNSADSFYRGDIARRLAEQFQKNGGLVTVRDLAEYHAREVEPLRLDVKGSTIFTAPLTAGGLTVLQALSVLNALNWKRKGDPAATQARLEAIRYAWKDRLELLGDPEKVKAPVAQLLSLDHARELAHKIEHAVKARQPAQIEINPHEDEGTNNISCVDRYGNMVAATFTHGSSFGAQVTADGLGLTLGHGMSRFDPRPHHPNAPGPGKRPLNNMCPSIVFRHGKPVMAVGGAGGLRIPNSIYDVLVNYAICGDSLGVAIAAPRMHCTGTLSVGLERKWPRTDAEYLKHIGFKVQDDTGAYVSAVTRDPRSGEFDAAAR